MDKEKRREYEAREKAIRDYNHQMYHAEKRGLERGIDRTNQLTILLAKENRLNELVQAASDPELQEALFKEFGL
jgi:hypothetical protein